jgi:hypothetical protein
LPVRARITCSGLLMRRSPTVTEMSPPRISRDWVARPRRNASAVELAAAIAATPSARQARKMRKPLTPERSSRAAKRNASGIRRGRR